jgi:molecular chaperone DnaJ
MAEVQRDYYEVLGVSRDADEKTLKDAFRKLAKQYHPDRNQEEGAEARFKEIAEAYAVLSDADKRKAYDTGGFAGVSGFSPEDLFGGLDLDDLFGGGFGYGAGGGIFDRFFGHRRPRGVVHGENIYVELVVPLETIDAGGKETVRYKRDKRCETCDGSGAEPGTTPESCDACGGKGQQVHTQKQGNTLYQQISPCMVCGGRGQTIDKPCPDCHKRGVVFSEEAVTITIPPGVADGVALRVAGHGHPSPTGDGPPGDLRVIVRTAPDPRFVRQGPHLVHHEILDVPDAVLGTSLRVPCIGGDLDVKVPPGTQAGTRLRLRGKGLPASSGEGHGDLFVLIDVRLPRELSDEEKDLYEKLRALRAADESPAVEPSDD